MALFPINFRLLHFPACSYFSSAPYYDTMTSPKSGILLHAALMWPLQTNKHPYPYNKTDINHIHTYACVKSCKLLTPTHWPLQCLSVSHTHNTHIFSVAAVSLVGPRSRWTGTLYSPYHWGHLYPPEGLNTGKARGKREGVWQIDEREWAKEREIGEMGKYWMSQPEKETPVDLYAHAARFTPIYAFALPGAHRELRCSEYMCI